LGATPTAAAGGRFNPSPWVWAASLGKDLRVRRTLAAAVAAVLALSLAACSEDDPEPKFTPTESTSPSTPHSSPTVPPKTEPWEKNTRAGAVAFVKHWIAVFNDAQDDGDVAELRALSESKCKTCNFFADRTEAIYANGGFYRSKGWEVLKAAVAPPEGLPRNERVLLLQILRRAERSKESSTADVVRNPDSEASYEAHLRWTDEGWRMKSVALVT
jgi:hypothetical protein